MQLQFRRTCNDDIEEISTLVRAIVIETYSHLFKSEPPASGDPARWADAHIAIAGNKIVGVGLSADDFISDLWVGREHRGQKIGAQLLASLETQMKSEGHSFARLRVVEENERARKFYMVHGWREVKTYPHERDGHLMVDMEKVLGAVE